MSLITPHLYLGNARNAQDINFLKSKKISFIINCAKELPNYFPNTSLQYLRLDLNDLPTQPIDQALTTSSDVILNNINKGVVTFVHCAAGISRSSSVVIYAIMKLHDWPFETSYRFVKEMHPNTHPNPGFVDQLIKMQQGGQHETEIITEEPGVYGVENTVQSEEVTSLTLDNEHPRPSYARSAKNTYSKIFSGSV